MFQARVGMCLLVLAAVAALPLQPIDDPVSVLVQNFPFLNDAMKTVSSTQQQMAEMALSLKKDLFGPVHTDAASSSLILPDPMAVVNMVRASLEGEPITNITAPPRDQRRCYFVHGLSAFSPILTEGQPPVFWTSSFPSYWGETHKYLTQCSSHVFVHQDTMHNSWHDEELYTALCESLTPGDPTRTIHNAIVFTHSMGGLILAAGLHANKCSLGANTTWYTIGMPPPSLFTNTNKTDAATVAGLITKAIENNQTTQTIKDLDAFCQLTLGNPLFDQATGSLFRSVACMAETPLCRALPDATYRNQILEILREHVTGAVCGSNPAGRPFFFSMISWIWTTEINDGAVATRACKDVFGSDRFSTRPSGAFFEVELNHGAIMGKYGDDAMIQWLEKRN